MTRGQVLLGVCCMMVAISSWGNAQELEAPTQPLLGAARQLARGDGRTCKGNAVVLEEVSLWNRNALLMYERENRSEAVVVLLTVDNYLGVSYTVDDRSSKHVTHLSQRNFERLQALADDVVEEVPSGFHQGRGSSQESSYLSFHGQAQGQSETYLVRYRGRDDHAVLGALTRTLSQMIEENCWVRNDEIF